MEEKIKKILSESIRVKEELLRKNTKEISQIANLVISCLKAGGKIILFGNGGSAADSQHIAAEFMARFKRERKALAALALTTNTSIITAIANDYAYEDIFSRQIEGLAAKEDLVIGISTSGRAKNVIEGIKQAKALGLKTVGLSGGDGGELVKIADFSLIVPSGNTARIQEAHITLGHILCEIAEEALLSQK